MSYIVSTSILGIQTFVTRFDPSGGLRSGERCEFEEGGCLCAHRFFRYTAIALPWPLHFQSIQYT